MCGIAGIVSLRPGQAPPELSQLQRMAGALKHRGPDEFGIFRSERAGLAHARLSIIDLSTGQQPLSNEDGSLWVVFNGEIFNYIELKAELLAHGHVFRTQSDTEVIVHAYEQWGAQAFRRFNGQFAIALWDENKKSLILVRDRVGVRPLYLCEYEGRVYFASEVKAIFSANAQIPRALDPLGIDQTFTFWSIVPPQSVWTHISELKPGHVRIYTEQGMHEEAFWSLHYPRGSEGEYQGSLDEAVKTVREALLQATSLRMLRADVPVGSYLSGGLDSSLVASLGRQVKGERFQTFSMRFADAEYDETEFQRAMVKQLGSDHHEVMISKSDIGQIFPGVIAHTERPILRTAPAPLYLLSKLVRDAGIKVVLTGEGADEMFAGYDLFREGKIRRYWAKEPQSQKRPLLFEKLYAYLARSPVAKKTMARQFFGRRLDHYREPGFAHETRWHTTSALKRLFSAGLRDRLQNRDAVTDFIQTLPAEFSQWTPLAQDQYLEVRTLLSGYLLSSQGDRMLMAHSVEGRFPFLDANVMELANSLPPAYKLKVLDEKHILKKAAEGLVPKEIIRRSKQPYRAPDAAAFAGKQAPEWTHTVMSEERLTQAGIFDPKTAGKLWEKCKAYQENAPFSNADNMAIVGMLSAQLLHEMFVLREPGREEVQPQTLIDLLAPKDRPQ